MIRGKVGVQTKKTSTWNEILEMELEFFRG